MYTQEEMDAVLAQKADVVLALKRRMLGESGVKGLDVFDALPHIMGEDEKEISESITGLAETLPVLIRAAQARRTVDPNPGNGRRTAPKLPDPAAEARARFDRLKKAGKI
ncbi:hypothetical protein [Paenibacillus contaminans]|uniref:Uncharacterized protein n=1 Tax=Paenibacillus contaminans TaxID=450362 RepID=A0A329MNL3_9BACL|nr:hypothetical protein [Paenibacillus contaminans]RAV19497.1 hypothetical protein DQG23_21150 [Paenibacillus contaminans]